MVVTEQGRRGKIVSIRRRAAKGSRRAAANSTSIFVRLNETSGYLFFCEIHDDRATRCERGRWRGRAEGRARGKDLYRAPAATAYWPGFGFCQPLLRSSGADTVMFVEFGLGFYGSAVTCHGQCCLMLVPSTGVLWEKRREKGRRRDTPQRSVNYMCIGWIEARQRASSSERRGGSGSPFLRNHGSIWFWLLA
jgi:hypothetical protein